MGRIVGRPLRGRNRGADRAALRSGHGVAHGSASGVGSLHVDFDGAHHRGARAQSRADRGHGERHGSVHRDGGAEPGGGGRGEGFDCRQCYHDGVLRDAPGAAYRAGAARCGNGVLLRNRRHDADLADGHHSGCGFGGDAGGGVHPAASGGTSGAGGWGASGSAAARGGGDGGGYAGRTLIAAGAGAVGGGHHGDRGGASLRISRAGDWGYARDTAAVRGVFVEPARRADGFALGIRPGVCQQREHSDYVARGGALPRAPQARQDVRRGRGTGGVRDRQYLRRHVWRAAQRRHSGAQPGGGPLRRHNQGGQSDPCGCAGRDSVVGLWRRVAHPAARAGGGHGMDGALSAGLEHVAAAAENEPRGCRGIPGHGGFGAGRQRGIGRSHRVLGLRAEVHIRALGAAGVDGSGSDYRAATVRERLPEPVQFRSGSGFVQNILSGGEVYMTAKTIFCAALLAAASWSQSYLGALRGTVLDGSGKSIGDTKVTLVDEAGGGQRATISTAEGFNFSQVVPATYTVVAEAPGFKKFERKHVIVATQETVSLDLKMEIGSVSESVQVTEEVPLIETSNASQGQVLDRQQLVDLPNLGRNPFMMSKLAQNVTPVGDPHYNRMEDQSGSSQISIAGGPVRGNNYLLDGIPITDAAN